MLALVYAENSDKMSVECWTYRGEAMRNLASLLEVDGTTVNDITIGAILMLTGVDVSPLLLFRSVLESLFQT